MNQPRRHHVTPELHLRGFADNRMQVKVVSRDNLAKSYVSSMDNATVQNDFYAVETHDGLSQIIETELLAKVEGKCAPSLARLLDGAFPPSAKDRSLIAMFLAVQWARGEGRIEQVEATIQQLVELTTVNVTPDLVRRYFVECENRAPSEDEVHSQVAFLSNPDNYRIKVHRNRVLLSTFELVDTVMRLLVQRKWSLLRAGDAAFLTSDAPVALWSAPDVRHFGVGVGTAQEIVFPIDRKRALLLSHASQHGEVAADATPEMVKSLNLPCCYQCTSLHHSSPGRCATCRPRHSAASTDRASSAIADRANDLGASCASATPLDRYALSTGCTAYAMHRHLTIP
jgi:hypothetical protein